MSSNEKNIANTFEKATEGNAVLLLDEADTFLYSRESAQRSWEVSAVNEMLTQVENFEGIFIASTNLIDMFDSAALRRFDFKIKFTYLSGPQSIYMFKQIAKQHRLKITESNKQALLNMPYLTPGDFQVLKRRLRFLKDINCDAMLEILEQECAVKPECKKQKIGF